MRRPLKNIQSYKEEIKNMPNRVKITKAGDEDELRVFIRKGPIRRIQKL